MNKLSKLQMETDSNLFALLEMHHTQFYKIDTDIFEDRLKSIKKGKRIYIPNIILCYFNIIWNLLFSSNIVISTIIVIINTTCICFCSYIYVHDTRRYKWLSKEVRIIKESKRKEESYKIIFAEMEKL